MNNELASTYTKLAIEQLLNVLALTAMARGSPSAEHSSSHLQTAAGWMPGIKALIADLDKELSEKARP